MKKIIKEGNGQPNRHEFTLHETKFTCHNCSCYFVTDEYFIIKTAKENIRKVRSHCPQCSAYTMKEMLFDLIRKKNPLSIKNFTTSPINKKGDASGSGGQISCMSGSGGMSDRTFHSGANPNPIYGAGANPKLDQKYIQSLQNIVRKPHRREGRREKKDINQESEDEF